MRALIALLPLALLACSGSGSKKGPGGLCKQDSDCLPGVYCAMGTCDLAPCGALVAQEGELPQTVRYEVDDSGREVLRTEFRKGEELMRAVTRHEENHRVAIQETFMDGGKEPVMRVRSEYDAKGRIILQALETQEEGQPPSLQSTQRYRYEDASCPYGATGTLLAADGSEDGTMTSICEEGRVVRREERAKADGRLRREQIYEYDDKGRWTGVRSRFDVESESFNHRIEMIRDGSGRIAELRHYLEGNSEPQRTEINDYSCLEIGSKGAKRK